MSPAMRKRAAKTFTTGDYRGRGRLSEGFVHNMYGPQPRGDTTSREGTLAATGRHREETLRFRKRLVR